MIPQCDWASERTTNERIYVKWKMRLNFKMRQISYNEIIEFCFLYTVTLTHRVDTEPILCHWNVHVCTKLINKISFGLAFEVSFHEYRRTFAYGWNDDNSQRSWFHWAQSIARAQGNTQTVRHMVHLHFDSFIFRKYFFFFLSFAWVCEFKQNCKSIFYWKFPSKSYFRLF